MTKFAFPMVVLLTMFVADYAGAANPHGPRGGMPANSQAIANSNGIRAPVREFGTARATERHATNAARKAAKQKPAVRTRGRAR